MNKKTESSPKKPVQKFQAAARKAAQASTASAPTRRYRSVFFQFGLIAVTVAFAALTLLARMVPFFPIDLQITRMVQLIANPLFAQLMALISWPGFSPQSYILAVLMALLIWAIGLHWEAVAALLGAMTASGIDELLKVLIQRPRPPIGLVHVIGILNGYGFPSGHVMYYVVFFGFICFLGFALLTPSAKRTLLLAFFGGLVLLIGVSRIYLGQHWASDVAGAYLLGSLILVANIALYRWGKLRFFVSQPVNSSEKSGAQ